MEGHLGKDWYFLEPHILFLLAQQLLTKSIANAYAIFTQGRILSELLLAMR